MRAPLSVVALLLVAGEAEAQEITAQEYEPTALNWVIGFLFLALYFASISIPVARILRRAGYNPWLALLMLIPIPIVSIVVLLIWGFENLPRAGYNRWLALLPLWFPVSIVALWMFAFAKWTVSDPSERNRNQQLDNWSEEFQKIDEQASRLKEAKLDVKSKPALISLKRENQFKLRRLYDRCADAVGKPHAAWVLGVVSFAQGSFSPVPPDIMLIPMSFMRPERAWYFAKICTLASVAGGLLGYLIGALLYDMVGVWLLSFYGLDGKVETFREGYAQFGALLVLLQGLTPFPYKLMSITAGFAGYNLPLFVVLSLITQGARFFVEAFLFKILGKHARF